jgi:hypothetical protein
MKNLFIHGFTCAITIVMLFSCTTDSIETLDSQIESEFILESTDIQMDCAAEDPQAQLTNNGTIPIKLEIFTIDGIVLHVVESISPGATSSLLTFSPNEIIFNISKNTSGIQDDKVVFVMNECMRYDMVVGLDNYLVAGPPTTL